MALAELMITTAILAGCIILAVVVVGGLDLRVAQQAPLAVLAADAGLAVSGGDALLNEALHWNGKKWGKVKNPQPRRHRDRRRQ